MIDLTRIIRQWPQIIACGILKKEINLVIEQNQWPLKVHYIDSSLHIDLDRLSKALIQALSKDKSPKMVIYGECHPNIDQIVADANATRIQYQNCIELVLGRQHFTEELSKGAFFLFEDWANRWEYIGGKFMPNWDILRQIYQDAHKYILCLRSPCSENFQEKANEFSQRIGLPLVWEDFTLEHLADTLKKNIDEFSEELV